MGVFLTSEQSLLSTAARHRREQSFAAFDTKQFRDLIRALRVSK